MSIFYRDNCPICNGKLSKNQRRQYGLYIVLFYKCNNKCYEYQKSSIGKRVILFGKEFHNLSEKSIEAKEIIRQINYWKKNECYLMKIILNK